MRTAKQLIAFMALVFIVTTPVELFGVEYILPYIPTYFYSQPPSYEFQIQGSYLTLTSAEPVSQYSFLHRHFRLCRYYSIDSALSEPEIKTVLIDIKGSRCASILRGWGAKARADIDIADATTLQFKLVSSIDTYTIERSGDQVVHVQPKSGRFTTLVP